MIRGHRKNERRGATIVEFALVLPVLCLLLFGTIIAGLGVFRYQRVANMSREAARYALVHSGQWAQDFNNGVLLTPTDIYNNAIAGQTVGFDISDVGTGNNLNSIPTNKFAVVVQYDDPGQTQTTLYAVTNPDNSVTTYFNQVRVLIRYNWQPELYWGVIPLQSESVMRMAYQFPK